MCGEQCLILLEGQAQALSGNVTGTPRSAVHPNVCLLQHLSTRPGQLSHPQALEPIALSAEAPSKAVGCVGRKKHARVCVCV